jgi:hypothetical protein
VSRRHPIFDLDDRANEAAPTFPVDTTGSALRESTPGSETPLAPVRQRGHEHGSTDPHGQGAAFPSDRSDIRPGPRN